MGILVCWPGRAPQPGVAGPAGAGEGWGSRDAPASAPLPCTLFGFVPPCPAALGSASAPFFALAPVLLSQRDKPHQEGCTGSAVPVKAGTRSHGCGSGEAGSSSGCPTSVLSSGEVLAGCCCVCGVVRQTGTSVACGLCVRAGAGADSSAQLCPCPVF